ncbi:hypothetical protein [Paraliomyxa miuraensis]|uniref:hypothetical protein n=1 Tax=Paraliomyxa miuraensis TaxID=376150 RepID=UPI0022592FCD|nr:hypothetical protein [Paraliomyxa miuraensis]MCX4246948.1 hypothetical protein [Paraliomyxa miuraensis]
MSSLVRVSSWARLGLAALLLGTACGKSEASPVEHEPVQLDQTQRATMERLVGSWKHVGGAQEQDAALKAVEQATESMSSLIRGVARSRLEETVRIDAVLSIAEDRGIVTITRSEVPEPFVCSADGRERPTTTSDGDDAQASLRIEADALVSKVVTDQGGGERTHRIDEQGQLVITARTFSPRLPADVVYEARYAR